MKMIEMPSGLKDMVETEAQKKFILQRRIEDLFLKYGYRFIMTPDIEFYQTYATAYTSVEDTEMYKFFDQDGQILTLRADMTIPIARVVASKYAGEQPPFRFCYTQNVYKVRQAFAGKRNEVTDCGIELIGEDAKSDSEVIVLALEVMKSLGVSNYTVEIGNSNFFKMACQDANISKEDMAVLADKVDCKSMVELQEYLDQLNLSEDMKSFFAKLPLLNGKSALNDALDMCFSERLVDVVQQMKQLSNFLNEVGYGEYVTFDLSKVPHLDYYTGIIFEGYIAGAGQAVLSGGRYDDLLKKFGRDLPACGFGVKIDPIAEIIDVQERQVTKVVFPESMRTEAFKLANELRSEENVELVCSEDVMKIEVIK